MENRKIGAFIAERRKESGLTQQALADRLGLTNKAVSKWETGDGLPDITILPALAENLGVTVDELLAGERRPKTPEIGEQTRKYLEDRAHRRQVIGLLAVAVIGVCGGLLRTSEWLYWVMLIVSIAGYIGVHVYFPGKEPLRRRVLFGALWGAGMKGLPFVALYTSWMRGQIADGSTPKAVIKDLVIDWYEWTERPFELGEINQRTTQIMDVITTYYRLLLVVAWILTMLLGMLLAFLSWKVQHKKNPKIVSKD